MIKHVIFDVDGVLIEDRSRGPNAWYRNLEKDLSLNFKQIQAIVFDTEFEELLTGRMNLHELLCRILRPEAAAAFVDYWLTYDSNINPIGVQFAKSLRLLYPKIELHIGSNQEAVRGNYISTALGFDRIFDSFFFSSAVGARKPNFRFYSEVTTRICCAPDEIYFLDDVEVNIEGAKNFGWSGRVWRGSGCFEDILSDLARR